MPASMSSATGMTAEGGIGTDAPLQFRDVQQLGVCGAVGTRNLHASTHNGLATLAQSLQETSSPSFFTALPGSYRKSSPARKALRTVSRRLSFQRSRHDDVQKASRFRFRSHGLDRLGNDWTKPPSRQDYGDSCKSPSFSLCFLSTSATKANVLWAPVPLLIRC
jgi:hypothetical protein